MAGNPDGKTPMASDPAPDGRGDAARRAVTSGRLRMRVNLSLGRLLTLAAPLLGVLALYFSLSWFGVFRSVPDWLRLVLLGLFGLGLLASLWPLTRFRSPTRAEIVTRLETDNHIANQAIATQDDTLEASDPFARALWNEHRRRMAGKIGTLQTGLPRSTLPRRDPWGIRVAIALLLFVAFGYSFSGNAGRPGDAFVSHAGSQLPDIRIDAWITPPPYVRQAPVFLTGADRTPGEAVDAIEGSEITVRVGGSATQADVKWGPDTPSLVAIDPTDVAAIGDAAPSGATTWTFKPGTDGELNITAGSSEAVFAIRLIADEPPLAAFVESPRRAVNGALELDYTLSDDHGIAKAEAEIVPAADPAPNARPLYDPPKYRLSLPRRSAQDNRAVASHDLTEHPLAGQKVRITLVATDGAGQQGRSETLETVLPGRRFSEPLAAAVVEQRGVLALDANNLNRVFDLHAALTVAPEETIPNLTHYLLLQSVRARLEYTHSDEDLRAAIDYMWGVALQLEDGNLSLAERRLRDAQNALAEALENGASDEQISQLMDDLREAMQDYMRELARQNPNSGNQQSMPDNMLRQRDLDNMLDQIETLARSGARDQAQQMLQELQRMMNNLQAGRQQRQQQQGGPMRQQMDKLGELMRQQQQLMDETMRADRERQSQSGEGRDRQQQGEQQPGQGQDQGQQGQGDQSLEDMLGALGRSQQQLRDALGQLQSDLEDLGIQPSPGFGEAGEAMGDAAGSLQQGETGQALSEQGRALQALRQGAEDMMNQMMQAMGDQQGEAEGQGPDRTGNRSADDRDPLGRPRSTRGPDFGSRVKVPDEIDIQRAREILDAIRKRLGDQLSPDVEKRYLERLLDLK
ncbi:TIGR02302 family protein [Hoeflea sp. YIM 152468]|uniref:TIGR02302 family protein n=1 Tax=Hoeflea sp. YIM 152468 TaxID=3031759 RepID=UPI0023DA94DD|nr:TIGR02302 family protein [Hoeflea sp. YIM 152468]MDF1608048.1 TIGR02302 family protein [Hoeflea sp. YIM 152468]